MAGCCKRGTESSGSINCGKVLDSLRNFSGNTLLHTVSQFFCDYEEDRRSIYGFNVPTFA